MSFDVNWDIDKYKEEHESEDHWMLRRNFLERWKESFPEERLVCLARVFVNMEFMGCRYPLPVMQEVARMSKEVAKDYRDTKKTKIQRTFVSASDAAEDRARGIKREGGVVFEGPPRKSHKIEFVKPGTINEPEAGTNEKPQIKEEKDLQIETEDSEVKAVIEITGEVDKIDYLSELSSMKCLDVSDFKENMFRTKYGKLVILVRSWAGRLWNLQTSFQACRINLEQKFDKGTGNCTVFINGLMIAEATGCTKTAAKKHVGDKVWNIMKEEAIMVLVKEQFLASNDSRISLSDVSGRAAPRDDQFGTPIENSIASKMMKMMGWKGGGLGADAQGIAEPIKPHLQMVNRAGLGSTSSDIRQIKRAAQDLMRRYHNSDCIDVDLVFSKDFSKEERAALHQCAKNAGLVSRSYGHDNDRCLVVRKKLNPFSLVHAIIEKGGDTPKYRVFIPSAFATKY